jgi:ferredoxin
LIITEQKKLEKILEYLKDAKSVYIIGCGRCATSCETGGEKQVAEMAEKLKESGKKISGAIVIEAPCDDRMVLKSLKGKKKTVEGSDGLLVMSCGAGVQTVAELADVTTYPALESLFLGRTKRLGKFYEMCLMCGDCTLEETGGICSVARCSKHLLNGPCGGSHNGKCEVDPKYDCAWYLIYERVKDQGMLDKLRKRRKPKDYSKIIRPRKIEYR